MNPLFNQMNSAPITGTINELKALFNATKNPMALFNQAASNNPQLKPILDALQSGRSPRQIFTEECQKRGIDPQQFMNSI